LKIKEGADRRAEGKSLCSGTESERLTKGLGVIIGIIFAERVRRKYGCTQYMPRLISTSDISPTDTFDKKFNKSSKQNKS
jgi:hypothetical protein